MTGIAGLPVVTATFPFLAGAYCPTIHTPADELPALLSGLHRVLAPGGQLPLAFQAGERPLRIERPWGHPVTPGFHRRRPEDMTRLLREAGSALTSRTVREPEERLGESVSRAYLLARKSAQVTTHVRG
ncbi:hypothetical protein ABZ478_23820 [Streptomyces sp. NPDC005706]|uniref:hypothetical protein n=1 Tax=Streptomyces sp. NPDC005706 TaxID=3157169 RepID=UPI0033E1781C